MITPMSRIPACAIASIAKNSTGLLATGRFRPPVPGRDDPPEAAAPRLPHPPDRKEHPRLVGPRPHLLGRRVRDRPQPRPPPTGQDQPLELVHRRGSLRVQYPPASLR